MKNINIYYLGCLFFSLYGCGHLTYGVEDYGQSDVTLSLTNEKIRINLPSDVLPNTVKMQVIGNDLYWLNKKKNEIIRFNLIANRVSKRTEYSVEGPNGIRKIQSFFVHNKDSIFMKTKDFHNIFLVDFEGEVLKKINIRSSADSIYAVNSAYGIHYYEGKLLVNVFPEYKRGSEKWENQYTVDQLSKFKVTKSIDLAKDTFTFLPIKFGASWGDPAIGSLNSDSYIVGSSMVYSFPADPNVFVYNFESNQVDIYNASSEYFKGYSVQKKNPSLGEYIYESIKGDRYVQIINDPYRRVYYRVMNRGVDLIANGRKFESNQMMQLDIFRPLATIIILNDKFQKIGEYSPPFGKHNFKNMFVAEQGLCISDNHFLNPDFDEDHLVFSIYTID